MRYIVRILLVFLAVSMPMLSEGIPHLILYFDINKTLIASDKAGNKSIEDVLNELLAEKYEDLWDGSLREMTFDAYVHEVLVPGSADSPAVQARRRFYLQHFITYLHEQNHPHHRTILQEYETILNMLKSSNSTVFTSFYALLDVLDRKGISYSIILRSFGEEVFDVKTEIQRHHKTKFSRVGKFREGKLFLGENESISDSREIYHQFRRIAPTAIHDDWNYWNVHHLSTQYGKPFYVDREDRETLSIFFDDNIRTDDSTNNIIAPIDATTGRLIPMEDLVESGQAVRVNTLEAILNADYYVNLVREAIDKHASKGNDINPTTTAASSHR